MALVVLHHTDEVGLGSLAEPIEARDLDVRHVDVATGPVPDDLEGVDGVLVLGGRPPEGSDAEVELLRAATQAEVPVFGICHGAELLAEVLGGEVADRERPEVRYVALHRTAPGREDDVSAGWPDGAHALAFHGREVIRLPDGAEQLLIGSDGPSMWRVGSTWATQLHVEATADVVDRWLADGDGRSLAEAAGTDPDELADEARRRERFTRAVGTSLVLRWLDAVATA